LKRKEYLMIAPDLTCW